MKKATREFLKYRPTARQVAVRPTLIRNALANDCYGNACKFADSDEETRLVVGGWLVGDFLKDRGTAIIPHYWVYNEKTFEHFDPTPKNISDTQNYEYIWDSDVMAFGNPKRILPCPLRLLGNGKIQARINDVSYIDLDKVDLAALYALSDSPAD